MTYINAFKWISTTGSALGFKDAGGKPRVSTMPYTYDIAEGNVAAHSGKSVNGIRSGIVAAEVDAADHSAAKVPLPTSSISMEVVSTDAVDTVSGGGARQVEIHGLNESWVASSSTVNMGGASATPIGAWRRINGVHVASAGTVGNAVGTVKIRSAGAGPTNYARISPGYTRSLQAVYSVPSGKTAYVTDLRITVGTRKDDTTVLAQLMVTMDPQTGALLSGLFIEQDTAVLGNGLVAAQPSMPIAVPARGTFKATVLRQAGTVAADASVSFAFWLEDA